MLVVSLVLAAVLLAGSGNGDGGEPGAAVAETAALTTATLPTATPEPAPLPPIPFDLQERLNALPEKLRNETQYAYSTGTLSLDQLARIATDYENRNPSVRVGSVLTISEGLLRFEVFTTGEQAEVATGEQTLIRRGDVDIALEDLLPEELIMVVSTNEGAIALTIEAFGVAAP